MRTLYTAALFFPADWTNQMCNVWLRYRHPDMRLKGTKGNYHAYLWL